MCAHTNNRAKGGKGQKTRASLGGRPCSPIRNHLLRSNSEELGWGKEIEEAAAILVSSMATSGKLKSSVYLFMYSAPWYLEFSIN